MLYVCEMDYLDVYESRFCHFEISEFNSAVCLDRFRIGCSC